MKVTELVTSFARPIVEGFGCRLWDVEYVREGSERYLRLYIDKDGGVDIDDCEKIHRAVDPVEFYLESLEPIEILSELAADMVQGGQFMRLFDADWDQKYAHGTPVE